MERSRKSSASTAGDEPGPIGVGAKGTIVSLMAKELQIEGSRRLAPAQIQHLPVRNEAVSVYCGLKNTCKSSPAKNITKANSFKERRTSSCSNGTSPSVKQSTSRSSSLRESSVRVLQFPSPKSMTVHHQRRKRIITYDEAAGSGMFSFLDSDEDDGAVPFTTTMTTTKSMDDLVPILTPSRKSVHQLDTSGSRLLQQCRSAYPSVEVADIRCYGAGRDMFRPAPKATKLSFWKLAEVKQSSKR